MTLVDQSIALVRTAVSRFRKKPLAAVAGVSDAMLRNVYHPDWSPTASSLRKLERAALTMESRKDDAA